MIKYMYNMSLTVVIFIYNLTAFPWFPDSFILPSTHSFIYCFLVFQMVNFKEAGLEVAALVYNHHNAMTVAIGSECGLAWLVGKEDLAYQFEASLSTG